MKKVLWGVITVLIGAILIAAVGVGFHNQQYVAPAGTQVAKSDGTVRPTNTSRSTLSLNRVQREISRTESLCIREATRHGRHTLQTINFKFLRTPS